MIELTLPYPVSANRYWATRVVYSPKIGKHIAITYVTSEAQAFRDECAAIARDAGAQLLTGRLHMHLQLYPHRPLDYLARQRKLGEDWDDSVQCVDLGNCEKVLADALQGIVYEDDKQVWRQSKERMEPDAHGARVVVQVWQLERQRAQASLLEEAA